ncbi:MAG: hypothetical protein R2755_26405 [Acidimicrobiales bacterium]
MFFGYGKEPPLLADRIRQGIARISQTGLVDVHSWEDLPISGQLIIDVVKSAIDSSTIAAFDVTTCNSNVLFELGYAIGSNKPVWLLFDASDEYALQRWNKVRTLTTLGYSSHRSSEDVQAEFLKHFETLLSADTVFQRHIEGSLRPGAPASVFVSKQPRRRPRRAHSSGGFAQRKDAQVPRRLSPTTAKHPPYP